MARGRLSLQILLLTGCPGWCLACLSGGSRLVSPIGKRPFVDGSKTFDLRGAFPDFKFNEHDFRVDEVRKRGGGRDGGLRTGRSVLDHR